MLPDLNSALRQLRRAPGTALAAVLTLAVGIGATTAVFSFVAAVMSASTPADDMDRLVAVWSHNRGEAETKGLVSRGDFLAWDDRAQAFESIIAWEPVAFNLSGTGTPVRVSARAVTPGYLEFFRWRPAQGRGFRDEDFAPGAPRVIVISDVFWRNTLGGSPEIVGRIVRLDGEPAIIVGVLPPVPAMEGFFVPLQLHDQATVRDTRTMFVWARLRPGATIEQARSEMVTIGSTLEREFPQTNRGWTVNTRPLQEEFVGPQARLAFALLAVAVLAVLLIGCVNIANLLLARSLARRGELAVRLALGAGAWRLVRQLLLECACIASIGGVASLLVSRWTLGFLLAVSPIDSPWVADQGLNPRALAFTAMVALLATLVAGLAPALAARRTDLLTGLHATGRSGVARTRRTTRLLVMGQTAMAVVLLVVAGLSTRTLIAIERLEAGFDMSNVLTASVSLPEALPPDAAARWFDEALQRARQLPGVVSAGATSRLPFAGGRWNPNRGLEIEGRATADVVEGTWAVDYVITPGLIETLKIRMLDGRALTDADGAGAPLVAIVSEAMARRFWPNRSPLGASLRQGDEPAGQWRTVVGLAADVRNDDADQPPLPYLYVPLAQKPVRTMSMTMRTVRDPLALADPLRRAIGAFDPDQALYDVRTMEQVWEADLAGSRVIIQVFGALAGIALGLAGLGVLGVTAQSVGQRTREVGVRVALGASTLRVAALIVWQGLLPVIVGLVLGLAGGLAIGRVMRSILFQVSPTDPLTLVGTITVLIGVGAIATIGPALRAARLDPLVALRTE